MQTRNYIVFLVLSMGILIGWETFVAPRLFPRKPVAKNEVKNNDGKDNGAKDAVKQPDNANPPKADDKTGATLVSDA